MFHQDLLAEIPESKHIQYFGLLEEVSVKALKKEGKWYAGYVRLRMIAIKN